MIVARNIIPIAEPVTVAIKETVSRTELRLSLVEKAGQKKVDLRVWDVCSDGTATPQNGGYTISMADAAKLRDAIDALLEVADD